MSATKREMEKEEVVCVLKQKRGELLLAWNCVCVFWYCKLTGDAKELCISYGLNKERSRTVENETS